MILLVGTFGNAMASNLGPAGSGDDTTDPSIPHPDGTVSPDDDGEAHFLPHTIDACPTAVKDCPPILKIINALQPGTTIPLTSVHEEWIIGSGGPPWSDWHESTDGPGGWIFTGVQIAIVGSADSCPNVGTPLTGVIMSGGAEVWIDFDPPLIPNQKLCLWKDVGFTGLVFDIFQVPDMRILEWPTIDEDRTAVGGQLVPLDTTMVLVAGSQTTAAWMIPVIVSGIGIAIVIARKF